MNKDHKVDNQKVVKKKPKPVKNKIQNKNNRVDNMKVVKMKQRMYKVNQVDKNI